MSSLFRDVKFGFRTLGKSPGLAAVAVLALTLGIGLTTTGFSIVYGALMKGLPFEDGDRIVTLERVNPERFIDGGAIPVQDLPELRAQQKSFTGLAAYTSGTMNLSGTDRAERYDGSWVTANIFSMVGEQPFIGRNFVEGDDSPSAPDIVMLSHSVWMGRFSGDSAVVGRTVRINGVPHEVVGVMPEGFAYPNDDGVWLPLKLDPDANPRPQGPFYNVVGKLRPGVSQEEAIADLGAISARLAAEYPEANGGFSINVQGFVDSQLGDEPRQLLYTMLGAVFFILLIACSNVANLLLDRAAHRSREVGIRSALGATRRAVVALFLSEALVLSLIATVLGIGVAYVGIDLFNRAIVNAEAPFFIDIRLHLPVLLFTIGVALLATLLSGLFPAIQASRVDLGEILKDESRGASGFRIGKLSKALVIFEIALSCGLLVAAGLMVRSVTKLRNMDPGFQTTNVFTSRVGFPAVYTDTLMQRQFFRQLEERVSALPGVTAASISSGLPGARQNGGGRRFALEGGAYQTDADYPQTRSLAASPGFFPTLGLKPVQGRLFDSGDQSGSLEVVVVNERFVREFFPDQDAIGRRIRYGTSTSELPWMTIVGVVPDMFAGNQDDPFPAMVIRPFAQEHSNFAYIAASSSGAPLALTAGVRDAVASLNPDIPIYWTMTLADAIAAPLWFIRVFGTMFMIFGLVALFLASVGLYAVMSFSVSRRTREVGIRMALGAQAADVVRMIFRQGVWQLVIGLGLGMALALGISQLMSVILFGVQPRDPLVFGGVVAVLTIAGVMACLIPSRNATRVDPLVALRSE